MTDKELKRLSRKELLEVLVAQAKEVERLTAEKDELQQELERRQNQYSGIGSLAETVLRVNRVYEDAQKAANQYLEEIVRLKKATQEEHDKAQAEAKAEAGRITAEAKKRSEQIMTEAEAAIRWIDQQIDEYLKEYPRLSKYLEGKKR